MASKIKLEFTTMQLESLIELMQLNEAELGNGEVSDEYDPEADIARWLKALERMLKFNGYEPATNVNEPAMVAYEPYTKPVVTI